MKISRVLVNNRKKCFVIEAKGEVFEFPYSQLKLKPSAIDPIVQVFVDPELAHTGFTYVLASGKDDAVLLDHVLYYNEDPEIVREMMLHNLTLKSLQALKVSKLSKRELARKLKTSPRQLYRLLDPSFYGKSIDQMVKLLHALGQKVELRVQKHAA